VRGVGGFGSTGLRTSQLDDGQHDGGHLVQVQN
jgi:hypothetical protein